MLDQEQEQERVRLNYTQIKQEGHTLFTEVFVPSFRNGDGRYFWATATPLFDKEGNRVGGIESIRDITEYKHSQEERSQLESRLHHARMMETLMARLGHDLRTPLTPLFVLFPMMKERVSDPGLLRMLDICSKSASAMNRLVVRAQTLVTLSAAVRPERLEPITLLSVVEQAVADNADSIRQKNVACSHEIDHHIIVKAIPDQLRELFSNLISNAVRFSPKNGVIRITAERQDKAVAVAVHDDGIGLDPENLERIFDEFFKADESRHDIDAPGLGLSICKRIVSNHNGRIWAESPGIEKGTTIRFTINEHDPACRYDAKESL
jgi:signal transduction histidine kinase